MKKKIFLISIILICLVGTFNVIYAKYILTRKFSVNIQTSPFYFNAQATSSTISMSSGQATAGIAVKNYNLNNVNEFNLHNTNYKVSLVDAGQFDISVVDSTSDTQTIAGGSIQENTINIKFVVNANTELRNSYNVTLKLTSTSPYTKEVEIPITINRTYTLAELIDDGKILQETITTTDSSGKKITVPKDFKATNTTYAVNDGVVIQDEDLNEFTWVPCDTNGSNINAYAQNFDYNDGTIASKQWNYLYNYNDKTETYSWSDDGSATTYEIPVATRETSVNKYSGFYVGRYEAGLPASLNITSGSAYSKTDLKNTTNMIPSTKKYAPLWNYITQENALIVSKNMYGSSTAVDSALIDSYAWDTIITWIAKDSNYTEALTYSSQYGNYYDHINYNELPMPLYAIHKSLVYGSTFEVASKYRSLNLVLPNDGGGGNVVEICLGGLEATNIKNIYDMAGNAYEWTTESRINSNNKRVAIRRGGCFNLKGKDDPIVMRGGGSTSDVTDFDYGFRVVLYLK